MTASRRFLQVVTSVLAGAALFALLYTFIVTLDDAFQQGRENHQPGEIHE